MSASEFERWVLFYRLEPWGGRADDERAAMVASASLAPHTKPGHTIRPGDLLPRLLDRSGDEEPDPEVEEVLWRSWVRRCGGDIVEAA